MTIGVAGFIAVASADDKVAADADRMAVPSPPARFVPLTGSERLSQYLTGLASPETIVKAAASAGIRQWNGTPKEWGGGAQAYGERVGSAFAQHVVESTIQYGLSAALHEDNRYFVSQQAGFLRRTNYAVKSTFLARHNDGKRGFSFSRVGGSAGGAFISRVWQPRSTTSAGDGAVSLGLNMGAAVGFNVVREFLPDIKRRFHKK